MDEVHAKMLYCQGMVLFCKNEIKRWSAIESDLGRLAAQRGIEFREELSESSIPSKPAPAYVQSVTSAVTQPANTNIQVAAPPVQRANRFVLDPNARQVLRRRVAHLLKWLIIIFALSFPKEFYYAFAGYSLLVLSGLVDILQSLQWRKYFVGSRPSLDIQLVRLRERYDSIQKLNALNLLEEPLSEEDERTKQKLGEFLATFDDTQVSYLARFMYQSFFMFFYSALPECYPHGKYLT